MIVDSGPAVTIPTGANETDYFRFGNHFLRNADCNLSRRPWDCLRALSTEGILELMQNTPPNLGEGMGVFSEIYRPVGTADIFGSYGNVLTAYKYGNFKKMPMLVGMNREDTYGSGRDLWDPIMTADQYINALQVWTYFFFKFGLFAVDLFNWDPFCT